MDGLDLLAVLTIAKIVIGTGLFIVVAGSIYRFTKSILTIMGLLLLSNLLCLIIIMGLLS